MCVGLNSLHKYLYQLLQSTKGNQQGYGNNSDPITLNQYLYANANPISIGDPTGHFGEEIIAGEGNDLNAYASDASLGEGAMGEAEGVVDDLEARSLMDEAVADQDLGLNYSSDYDPGEINIDHIQARSLGGGDEEENLQELADLMNSRKGGLEGQISKWIQWCVDQGWTRDQAVEAASSEIESLGNSGFEIPVDPSLLDNIPW